MPYNFLRLFIILFLFLLTACSNNSTTEGNYVFPHTLKSLKVGMDKQSIKKMLGPPTLKASFNENIWYYAYEISIRKLRFLEKDVTEAKIIRLTFDAQDKISKINIVTQDSFREIPYDDEVTITSLRKTKSSSKRSIDSFQ